MLVEGIKPKAMLGTRQVDLKDVVRMCVNTADCANASPEEKGVVGEVLREIIAANSRSRGARLGEVLSNVEQLGEKRVGHGASCALEAMLGVPRWTLDWLMARWSAQCPGGEAASWHASMSLDQSWQSVCSACTRDTAGKSHRPCQFAEEPGIDLALRLTVVRAAAASLGMAPGLCQGVLLRWLGSQAQQAAREGVEDMRWKAGFALATD